MKKKFKNHFIRPNQLDKLLTKTLKTNCYKIKRSELNKFNITTKLKLEMEQVEKIITQYINDSQDYKKEFIQIADHKLSDFQIESLELFEMLIAIEEIIDKEIPDNILSAEVTIRELVDKITSL